MRRFVLILTLCLSHLTAQAATSSDIEKSCLAHKKSKSLCACLVKNIDKRAKDKLLSEDQLTQLNQAAQGKIAQADGGSDASSDAEFNAMADYLAGLEFHCQENPKYLAD